MAMVLGNNQDHYGKQKAILFTFYFIPKNCRNNQRVMMHDWRTNEPTSGNNFMKPKAVKVHSFPIMQQSRVDYFYSNMTLRIFYQ